MRPFRLDRADEPLLDIWSYGRRTSEARVHLTPAQVEQIRRTVTRAPEVMVKVSGGKGGNSASGVKAHFSYIGRRGELEIETDTGEHLRGRGANLLLLNDWDLDLEQDRKRSDLYAANRRQPPKLVHKLIFSMPAGTPSDKVLSAVRDFAREEFGLKHRYAMVLHTDEPHPHVHVVVKAVSEDGVRLNIRKETLRGWREGFARHLRCTVLTRTLPSGQSAESLEQERWMASIARYFEVPQLICAKGSKQRSHVLQRDGSLLRRGRRL